MNNNKYYADVELGLSTNSEHFYYKYCPQCSRYFLNNVYDNNSKCNECKSLHETILSYLFKFFP